MIISITFDPSSSSSSSSNTKLPSALAKISNDELVLVELQGYLEMDDASSRERDGKLVGKLTMDESGSKPTLFIGHNLLEGKVVLMPKPLAVLVKGKRPEPSLTPIADDPDVDAMAVDETPVTGSVQPTEPASWHISAVVKRKILFSKRPLLIVGKSNANVKIT